MPEIQAFNVDEESTTVIAHPFGLAQHKLADCTLCSEGDLLCLVNPNVNNGSQWSMKFWIMKEYRNQSSWTKDTTPHNLNPLLRFGRI